MKKFNYLLLLLTITSLLFGQNNTGNAESAQPEETDQMNEVYKAKEIIVEDVKLLMSKGKQPGFRIEIPQSQKKEVTKSISKHIKEKTKSKIEEQGNELFIIGTILNDISNKPLNVYVILEEHKGFLAMNAFFEQDATFLSNQSEKSTYLSIKKYLRNYGTNAYFNAVEDEINGENNKLKKIQNEFDKLVNENDKLYKSISKENRNIDEANSTIETAELDQGRVKNLISSKKDDIYKIKEPEEKLVAENELKDFQKNLSKLGKSKETEHKSIVKSEAKIRDYERNIEDNEELMRRKKEQVDKQQTHIHRLESKRSAIK